MQRGSLIRSERKRGPDVRSSDGQKKEKTDSESIESALLGQSTSPIFSSLPTELAPRQPLKGWAHFLLRNVDPKKLEEDQTYAFTVIDSLPKEHPITRAAQLQTSSKVNTRRKRKTV